VSEGGQLLSSSLEARSCGKLNGDSHHQQDVPALEWSEQMMLTALAVQMMGGLWNVKNLCRRYHGFLGWVLRWLYYRRVAALGGYVGHTAGFGGKPILPHGLNGVFISRNARVGAGAVIFHQVTIGSNTIPGSQGIGAPEIGDDCYIGAGATIIGGIVVGDNVRIGANAVVTSDIPSNCVVVAQSARVIRKDQISNRFYARRGGRWYWRSGGSFNLETDPDVIEALERGFRSDDF